MTFSFHKMTISPDSPAKPPVNALVEFEFRHTIPVTMLPADELFSNGMFKVAPPPLMAATPKLRRRNEEMLSPKAPRCSSRWKDILGLKTRTSTFSSTTKSLKNFLNRSSKSTPFEPSLNFPLLKDSDSESLSVSSSRMSLSSSSSSHEHDDLPRLSLDSEHKQSTMYNSRAYSSSSSIAAASAAGDRVSRRKLEPNSASRVSVDSPRMNSSGKIVFHSLERSSSTPTSHGGNRYKTRIDRSYSANVRINPVLNVPVCSLRRSSKTGIVFGFPLFSSQSNRNHQYMQQKNGNSKKSTESKQKQ